MKSDTERKKFYSEKLHKKKNRLHVHLSKDLRTKVKTKKRAISVRKNDLVKVLRGPGKGKEAKVAKVSVLKRKVYVEGIVAKNSKNKEILLALEPSNLLLLSLDQSKERKQLFNDSAFVAEQKAEKKPHVENKTSK